MGLGGLCFQFTAPRQGWQCPCCRAVFSPDTIQCWNCRPQFQQSPLFGTNQRPLEFTPSHSPECKDLNCDRSCVKAADAGAQK